jgi:hypothetical protein
MIHKRQKSKLFLGVIFILAALLWAQNYENLKKKIEAAGKLKFKQNTPIRYMDKIQFKNYITSTFDSDYPVELFEKDSVFIRLMGFEDKNVDVRKTRKKLILNSVGGVYNEKKKEIAALNEYRETDLIHSMILVHELRHSLQDQYFGLTTLLGQNSVFDDRNIAVLAAIEGDASFMMVKCGDLDAEMLTTNPNSEALMSFSPIAKLSLMSDYPPIIKNQLIMPYVEGLRFVNEVYKKKKWGGVNKILAAPPDSTEQILHPEKYMKREKPVNVMISYKPGSAGDAESEDEMFEIYHTGVIGEYYANVLIKSKDVFNETDYALGWGGDTFCIYKNAKTAAYFLVWKSLWDNETYCSNFYSDFKRFLEKKFSVNFKEGDANGNLFIAGRSPKSEDYFFLTKKEKKMFYARTDNRKRMNTFIYGGNYD